MNFINSVIKDRASVWRIVLVSFLVLFYLVLFLPFWKVMILGFVFAAACQPVMRRIQHKFGQRRRVVVYSSIAVLMSALVGVLAVLVLNIYSTSLSMFQNPETVSQVTERVNQLKTRTLETISTLPGMRNRQLNRQLEKSADSAVVSAKDFSLKAAQETLVQTPLFLLNAFIFLVAFSAFLLLAPRSTKILAWMLQDEEEARIYYRQFEDTCANALGAVFLTAFVQAILITMGASFVGLDMLPMIFLGTFIFAMIPVLGAGLVGLVLALFLLAEGDSGGFAVMITMATIAGIADNIMIAWLFSRAAKTNTAISLISFLGGIALMGFAGLFIAPVLEQLVMKFLGSGQDDAAAATSTEENELKRFSVHEKSAPIIAPGV